MKSTDTSPPAEFASFSEQTRAVLQATLASRRKIRDAFVELRGIIASIERVAQWNSRRDSYGEIREDVEYDDPDDIYIVLNVANYLTLLDKYEETSVEDRDKIPLEGWVKLDEDIKAGDKLTIDLSFFNEDQETKIFEVTHVGLQNHIEQISKSVSLTVYRR